MVDEDMVTVATFGSAFEADMARSRLQAEGIAAVEIGGASAGVMPFLAASGGIQLRVAADDAERAREILGLAESGPEPPKEPYR